jgi:hypothetical protein
MATAKYRARARQTPGTTMKGGFMKISNRIHSFVQQVVARRLAAALAIAAMTLSGCVVTTGPDGQPWMVLGGPLYPPQPIPGSPPPPASAGPAAHGGKAMPTALNVRLYPANDIATQSGVLTGTVTNMMTGAGRFQFEYQGELLAGEATRVSGDERRGVASAFGPRGTYANCDYQMNTPVQGAGTCMFSTGAKYQVHIGR